MIKSVLILNLLVLSLFCNSNLFAQNFEQDLENAFQQLACSNQIMVDMDSWKIANSKKVESNHSIMKKNEEKFFYQIGNKNILTTPGASLIIDNTNKQIHYTRRIESNTKELDPMGEEKIKKILKAAEKIDYLGTSEQGKLYLLHTPSEVISKTKVMFDLKTGLVKKMVHYYNTELFEIEMEVHMQFNEINLEPKLDKKAFDEKSYVKLEKRKDRVFVQPSASYTGYQVSVHDF